MTVSSSATATTPRARRVAMYEEMAQGHLTLARAAGCPTARRAEAGTARYFWHRARETARATRPL